MTKASSITQKYFDKAIKILRFGVLAILVIAPFYAPLVIWLSSGVHHLDFLRIWKEIGLVFLLLVILFLLFDYQRLFRNLRHRPLLILSAIYIFFLLANGLWDLFYRPISNDAVIYGLLTDIRPIAMLAVAAVTFAISRQQRFGAFPWQKIVMIPAALVIGFGLLQMTVLPKDVLKHVGYNQSTVAPYQTVDNQPNIVRIQSTTRGPNPLGAYLIVVIVLMVELLAKARDRRQRLYWGLAIAASLAVLFGTYSRSAQVGLVLSLAALALIHYRQFWHRHLIPIGLLIAAVIGIGAIFRHSYLIQNAIFHTSNKSSSPMSSNAERTEAVKKGLSDVWHEPLGEGIGTAGPASLRNKQAEPRIAENYFLQIGQEVGIIGVLLFAAINIRAAVLLWRQRQNLLARVLLASLVGLTFVNLLSHAWTDDTLAYIWWGLTGLALAGFLSSSPRTKSPGGRVKATAPA